MSVGEELARRVAARGVRDRALLAALASVPRDRFVPPELAHRAWEDEPLPIGRGQTIGQPSAVAWTAELARVRRGSRVLDVGTGSGWQAAVLAAAGAEVSTVELDPELHARAAALLSALGCPVALRLGDGRLGWPERAPFDAVILGGALATVPPALLDQLAEGGVLVFPSGSAARQELVTLERRPDGSFRRRGHGAVAFLPLSEAR